MVNEYRVGNVAMPVACAMFIVGFCCTINRAVVHPLINVHTVNKSNKESSLLITASCIISIQIMHDRNEVSSKKVHSNCEPVWYCVNFVC